MMARDIPSFCNKVCACIGLCDFSSDASSSDSSSSSPVAEPISLLKRIIKKASREQSLLGTNDLQRAEISQWIYFSLKEVDILCLSALNNYLSVKSFLVGHHISLADYCVFVAVSEAVRSSLCDLNVYSGIKRWILIIQFFDSGASISLPSTFRHTLLPISSFEEIKLNTGVKSDLGGDVIIKINDSSKPSVGSIKGAAGTQCIDGSDDSQQDPTKLDIRCGLVLKCWNHPDSDKLLCEEVDLGKESGGVRTIASGIRTHYSAEELVGRKVLVLANLKERSMAGFKSQARIMPAYRVFCDYFHSHYSAGHDTVCGGIRSLGC